MTEKNAAPHELLKIIHCNCSGECKSYRGRLKCGSGKKGVEISARKNEKTQMMKMQEWKHRHVPAGVENAGVEVIEVQQQDNI